MRIFLALMLAIMATTSFAYTIKSIKFDSLVYLSETVALRMLNFEVGDTIDEEALDKSVKTYFKQGYFEDVWVSFENDEVTFHFKAKPQISKVELKGWKENDTEIKSTVVQIKVGTLYDEKKLEAAKKRIIEAINKDAKIDSVVEIKKEYLDNGSIKVTFIVNEGEEIIIQKQRYSGVLGLKPKMFDEVIANKEKQFMGWFWGRNNGKMKLSDLEYDHLRIRDLYMQYGYLDADVKEPFVKVDFDSYNADMSYQIKEGDIYSIETITIDQQKHVVDEALIREQIKMEVNKPFNIKTFREDADRIKKLIADMSYAFVQVVPDLKKNKENHTVEVVIKIMPGEKVKIRNVIISGNSRTLDRIIRRELYLGPGDMYSLTDLADSKNAIGRLGFFEAPTIEEKRIDNHTMDLIVKVKEAPTGNIQVGGGYGSFGGMLLSISVNDRNVWGSGINLGLRAERSMISTNYSFNVSNQKLNDTDFSGNFSLHTSNFRYNDYTVISDGFNFGVGHRFTRHISGHMGYTFTQNSYKFEDANSTNSMFPTTSYNNMFNNFVFQDYAKSSVIVSGRFDNTDDFYLPRRGVALDQSIEQAGLGSQANFIKTRTNFGVYKGFSEFLGYDLIARYKARFFYAKETGFLPVAERFYMGGIQSIRGYQAFSLSPTIADATGRDGIRRIGGEYTASNSFELSFPLVPKAKMRMVAFVDYGMIGTTEDSRDDYLVKNISRGGYGMGLEWFSPVGPIQLMFARPIGQKPGDRTAVFEFRMGQRF